MDKQELIDRLEVVMRDKLHEIATAALNAGAKYELSGELVISFDHEVRITLKGQPDSADED